MTMYALKSIKSMLIMNKDLQSEKKNVRVYESFIW